MIWALPLLLAGAQVADCPVAGGWPLQGFKREGCPQVYRIHGSAPVDSALNIVVMSDGFTAEELDDYRCAAGLMIEKLAATRPFNEYSESINVYRLDLVSAVSGIEFPELCGTKHCKPVPPNWPNAACQCRTLAERSRLTPPLRGEPVLPATHAACMQIEIDLRGCPATAPECQVMWPVGDGLRRLWRLAACAPAFDVVIVIANSGAWAGGGTDDLHPPLAVATLTEIGEWSHRSRLLAHEFGHALGLLDEYALSEAFSGSEDHAPAFHQGRNLVRVEQGKLPTHVPWEHLCTQGVAGLKRYAAGSCFTVCACEACDLPKLGGEQPVVGLFEGGFYDACEYFRPSGSCKMQDVESPFCPACAFYIQGLFQDLGMRPNPGGPVLTVDPDPACPLVPVSPTQPPSR